MDSLLQRAEIQFGGKRMMQVNHEAVQRAKSLIDEGKFRISTPWRAVQPSSTAEDCYIDQNGWEAFGQWYLAVDLNTEENTKEHYQFAFGDFNAIHRSGLIAAKQRAAQQGYGEIEAVADELLDLFDRL